jgi:RNA polymerase sigma-70 factor (ECF subfamily)
MKAKQSLAFEEIYDRYANRVFSYLYNTIGDRKTAEDVISNVFIKLYSYLQTTEWTNLKWLIYRMAHNEMVNFFKSNYYVEVDDQIMENIPSSQNDILTNIDTKFRLEQITKAMDKLDAKSKEVLYLYYHEQWSYADISTLLDTNINTVLRAKEKLKSHL